MAKSMPEKLFEMVVIEIGIRRSQAVNTPGRLHHDLVGIVLRIEHDGVRGDAVPSLAAGGVLNQIDHLSPSGIG